MRKMKNTLLPGNRSLQPASTKFGFDRGTPIDRFYIEQFLATHSKDIRGRVLEIADSEYSKRFGEKNVNRFDVLHRDADCPGATIIGDLQSEKDIPKNRFDCFLLTQTLHVIFDTKMVIKNIWKALKKGGVALITVPGISQISRYDMDRWGDFWRFTSLSLSKSLEESFCKNDIKIRTYGNVCSAAAFLYGLAAEELSAKELNTASEDYEVLITARVVKR